eukprot:970024_1
MRKRIRRSLGGESRSVAKRAKRKTWNSRNRRKSMPLQCHPVTDLPSQPCQETIDQPPENIESKPENLTSAKIPNLPTISPNVTPRSPPGSSLIQCVSGSIASSVLSVQTPGAICQDVDKIASVVPVDGLATVSMITESTGGKFGQIKQTPDSEISPREMSQTVSLVDINRNPKYDLPWNAKNAGSPEILSGVLVAPKGPLAAHRNSSDESESQFLVTRLSPTPTKHPSTQFSRPHTPFLRPRTPSARPLTPSTRPLTPSTRPLAPPTHIRTPFSPSALSRAERVERRRSRGLPRVSSVSEISMDDRKSYKIETEQSFETDGRTVITSAIRRSTAPMFSPLRRSEPLNQPTPATSPHLISAKQVYPGLSRRFFAKNRERVIETMEQNSVLILVSNARQKITPDWTAPFHQNSEFFYLSGYMDIGILALCKSESTGRPEVHLFVEAVDRHAQNLHSFRAGPLAAAKLCGADAAHSLQKTETFLPELLRRFSTIYFDDFRRQSDDYSDFVSKNATCPRLTEMVSDSIKIAKLGQLVRSVNDMIQKLMFVKQPEEIKLLRKAADHTAAGMKHLMSVVKPGMAEKTLEVEFEYFVKKRGATGLSFPLTVSSGPMNTVLAYTANSRVVRANSLVLVDGGAQCGYACDCTRVFPASGKFTREQRHILDDVNTIYDFALSHLVPGNSLGKIERKVWAKGRDLLRKRGIEVDMKEIGGRSILKVHDLGHPVGHMIHDCPLLSMATPLVPGAVVALEPGIYLHEGLPEIPTRYQGIGVRIEDTILITDGKPVVLTKCCRKADDIEKFMARQRRKDTGW